MEEYEPLLSTKNIDNVKKRFNGKIDLCSRSDFDIALDSIEIIDGPNKRQRSDVFRGKLFSSDVCVKIYNLNPENWEESMDILSEISVLKAFRSNEGIVDFIGAGLVESDSNNIKVNFDI